ncbi:metal-sensing transcriptional repressor [Vagococcus lutrae]|uniref:Metal-sensing transcriptional repressor n=2 Tax=Vagococcus lutrae TaxID=81947 RepID=A0AAE9XEV3_9ENTE|nr:metal-sensing transcriptional repressor [Vagococcus lutrae]MDO5741328.1 metal-sensing transcriptional repressor [Vagococcus sp.]MCO7150310.1 metal-sensing transcriptional repressor [Vagococcus lutrae]MDT2801887.1 metal-sensing transcriptional repressor [Vagococcus lutrae]MDT2806826.1 metal-sensing transcriptional repressor [Vagococcus lutrae]MDT2807240.1 metal-sensing transcriptional repressor [Vagococcus lutrae]
MQCDQRIMNRMRRAEGQMRGIQKMMLEEKECYDIMMQLSAVRSGIDNIMGIMAAENIKDCYENPLEDEQAQAERLAQAVQMIQKL